MMEMVHSSVVRNGSVRSFVVNASPLIATLFLSILVAAETPILGKDAQYYWQAGSLWAEGKVSYAGSLIGSRIYVVLYYYFFQLVFGQSIDSVSISMATLFLAFGVSAIWLCRETLKNRGPRAATCLLIIITGYLWLDWRRPQTEPFIVILAIVVFALVQRLVRADGRGKQISRLILIGLLCGAGLGFRTEALVLFASVLLVWLTAEIVSRRAREGLVGACVLAAAFVVGSLTPGVAFRAFTGQQLPPQLTGYFAFFHTMEAFGDPANGSASRELNDLGVALMREAPEPLDIAHIRLGLSAAYNIHGPEYASDLYMRAGIETVLSHPNVVLMDAASNIYRYVAGRDGLFRLDRKPDSELLRTTRERLQDIDRLRAQLSTWRFKGDYHWQTSAIADRRLLVGRILDPLDIPHVQFSLPGWAVIILACVAFATSARRPDKLCLLGIATVFCFGSMVAAALTQGFVNRYWLAATLPLIATIIACIAASIDRRY